MLDYKSIIMSTVINMWNHEILKISGVTWKFWLNENLNRPIKRWPGKGFGKKFQFNT